MEKNNLIQVLQDWELLLSEISRNGTALDNDALDVLNETIRAALTQPSICKDGLPKLTQENPYVTQPKADVDLDGLKLEIDEELSQWWGRDALYATNKASVHQAIDHLAAQGYIGGGDGLFKIGDIVQVSPNCEYYEDWKGSILEIVGIYRQRRNGYRTENTPPPIFYSVKDVKDSWTYGFTDDFSLDDLMLKAAPKKEGE